MRTQRRRTSSTARSLTGWRARPLARGRQRRRRRERLGHGLLRPRTLRAHQLALARRRCLLPAAHSDDGIFVMHTTRLPRGSDVVVLPARDRTLRGVAQPGAQTQCRAPARRPPQTTGGSHRLPQQSGSPARAHRGAGRGARRGAARGAEQHGLEGKLFDADILTRRLRDELSKLERAQERGAHVRGLDVLAAEVAHADRAIEARRALIRNMERAPDQTEALIQRLRRALSGLARVQPVDPIAIPLDPIFGSAKLGMLLAGMAFLVLGVAAVLR